MTYTPYANTVLGITFSNPLPYPPWVWIRWYTPMGYAGGETGTPMGYQGSLC